MFVFLTMLLANYFFPQFGLFLSVSREVSGRVNLTNLTKYYVTKENMDKVGEVFTPGKLVTCAVIRLERSESIF